MRRLASHKVSHKEVLSAIVGLEETNATDLAQEMGIHYITARTYLGDLIGRGWVEKASVPGSRHLIYRATGRGLQADGDGSQ